MSLGSWPEAAASDSRAVTTAVRSRVRTNMKTSVLDNGAWPLILPIFCPPQLDGAPTLSCCAPSAHSRNTAFGEKPCLLPPQSGSMEKKSDGDSSELERGLSLNMTVTLR